MGPCEGVLLGPNKTVNFGRVAIVSAVIWFIIFAVITGAVSTSRRGGYGMDWQNFGNWLDSSGGLAGLLFYSILAVLIPPQVLFFSEIAHRWRTQGKLGISLGRIVGIVGGLAAFIGVFLPWTHVFHTDFTGANSIAFLIVPGFGIFGLESISIPTKRAATLGLGCGIIALLGTLVAIPTLAGGLPQREAVPFDYGLYVTILGSLALIVGSALARGEAREVKTVTEAPSPTDGPDKGDAGGGRQYVEVGAYWFKKRVSEDQPRSETSSRHDESKNDEVPP
jgi:hypothetical protein